MIAKDDVFKRAVKIITKYSREDLNVEQLALETRILEDLEINSARLVDIVLDIEDEFDIEVSDESADRILTIGDGVDIIMESLK